MTDATLLRHVEAALRGHARALRRDGLPVPASLGALADVFAAMRGQGGTTLATDEPAADPAGMTPLLVTKRGAADLLQASERTVARLIADGRLPAVRLSDGAVRVRLTDLDRFVADLTPANERTA